MIDMHSKYANMHLNGMVYVLISINNHIITSINFMLSHVRPCERQCDAWVPSDGYYKAYKTITLPSFFLYSLKLNLFIIIIV